MYDLHKDKVIILIYYLAAIAAVGTGIIHLKNNMFDLMLSLVFYGKLSSLPALAYVLCNLLVLFIPLLMLVPTTYFPRGPILKKVLYAIAFCYLLGNTWVIYTATKAPDVLFSGDITKYYQIQYENAWMFNYRTWLVFSPWALIPSFIQAALFFTMARNVSEGKRIFSVCISISTLLSILLPYAFSYLFQERIFDIRYYQYQTSYFTKNLYLMLSQIATWAIFFSMSKSRHVWAKYLWTI